MNPGLLRNSTQLYIYICTPYKSISCDAEDMKLFSFILGHPNRREWCAWHKSSKSEYVTSSSHRQKGHHFADDIFKHISLKEKVRFWTKISLKFVPKGPTDNNQALV